jgi:hypothetical protein
LTGIFTPLRREIERIIRIPERMKDSFDRSIDQSTGKDPERSSNSADFKQDNIRRRRKVGNVSVIIIDL